MNCKGNELARLVVPEDIIGCEHHGKIIYITNLVPGSGEYPAWFYSGTPLIFEIGSPAFPKGTKVDFIADKFLRPIGNPSEDEVDETLLWKKVPDYAKPKEETTKS